MARQSSLPTQKFIMSNICIYRGVQVWLTGLLKCYHFIILVTVAESPGIHMQWYISSWCEQVCGPIVSIVICVHCFCVLSRNSHFFHNANILALLDWCLVVHMMGYTLNSEFKGTTDSPTHICDGLSMSRTVLGVTTPLFSYYCISLSLRCSWS